MRAKGLRALAAAVLLGSASVLSAQEAVSIARGSSRDSPDETVQAVAPTRAIEFPVELTTEILGNLAGGTSRRAIWESLLNVGFALDLEKAAGWKGGTVSVRAIYPQGDGLTDKAVHDFNTLSNIDGYDSLSLYDAWFEQEFAEESSRFASGNSWPTRSSSTPKTPPSSSIAPSAPFRS